MENARNQMVGQIESVQDVYEGGDDQEEGR